MLFYIFFTIYIRARPGCKKFVKMMFYVELRIDSAPCKVSLQGGVGSPYAFLKKAQTLSPSLGSRISQHWDFSSQYS